MINYIRRTFVSFCCVDYEFENFQIDKYQYDCKIRFEVFNLKLLIVILLLICSDLKFKKFLIRHMSTFIRPFYGVSVIKVDFDFLSKTI